MKVKNTRGGMKNNQEITVSLNHKGPFINFIKTGYTVPWDYLRIRKKKKNLSCSDTFKCKIYMRQSYAIIQELFHTDLYRLDSGTFNFQNPPRFQHCFLSNLLAKLHWQSYPWQYLLKNTQVLRHFEKYLPVVTLTSWYISPFLW